MYDLPGAQLIIQNQKKREDWNTKPLQKSNKTKMENDLDTEFFASATT